MGGGGRLIQRNRRIQCVPGYFRAVCFTNHYLSDERVFVSGYRCKTADNKREQKPRFIEFWITAGKRIVFSTVAFAGGFNRNGERKYKC